MGNGKQRYTQVKISVPAELAASFKAACARSGVSMAGILSQCMGQYCGIEMKKAGVPHADFSTGRKRRGAIKRIIGELERIRAAEERLVDNAPENLRDAPVYEIAEEYMLALDEAIEQLGALVP